MLARLAAKNLIERRIKIRIFGCSTVQFISQTALELREGEFQFLHWKIIILKCEKKVLLK